MFGSFLVHSFVDAYTLMKTNFLLLNSVVSVLILSEIGLKVTLLSPDTMKPVPPYDVDVCPELNELRVEHVKDCTI